VGGIVVTGMGGTVASAGAAATPRGIVPAVVGPMLRAPSVPGTSAQAVNPVALSSNWSGYASTTTGTKFNSVQGDFVQPSIVCTGAADRIMAAWVGLDGFSNKTVEQDGTFAACTGHGNMTPEYVAWYEMYPAGSVTLFAVNPGDEIEPAVSYSGGQFTLSITDATSGQTRSYTAACKSCRRASAEWIVERPELCDRHGACFLSSLPDFTSASLSADTAGTDAAAAASISSFTSTPIDMIQPVGPSVELLDQTAGLDATGEVFSTTWERTGKRLPVS
jgi:hypothetical protein